MASRIKFGQRSIPMPASRKGRIGLGIGLVIGGLLGFLPVLGFWMLPLGILILSIDICRVRKARRKAVVWWMRRRRQRKPRSPSITLLPPAKHVKISD